MRPLDNTSLPEDPGVEDEPLYRRRSRSIEVRRGWFPRRLGHVLGRLLLALGILLPCGYGGLHLAGYALSSPRFQMNPEEDVLIDGNTFVSREEVLSVLGLLLYSPAGRRTNVLRINLDEERKQVESIPWVRSAIVSRIFPNRLALHIVERTPVAFVNVGGKLKLVDGDGVLLEKPDKANFTFPVLVGLDALGNAGDRQGRLAIYQEFVRQLGDEPSSAGWLVSEVDLGDADDLKVLLVEGRETIQAHFGRNDFKQRFRDFLALLPEVRRTNTQIDSVDLRYRNQVVVNPKKAAAGD